METEVNAGTEIITSGDVAQVLVTNAVYDASGVTLTLPAHGITSGALLTSNFTIETDGGPIEYPSDNVTVIDVNTILIIGYLQTADTITNFYLS